MAIKGRAAMGRRTTGDALGYGCDVLKIWVRCTSCFHLDSEMVAADAKVKDAFAVITCGCCGRVGAMKMVKL